MENIETIIYFDTQPSDKDSGWAWRNSEGSGTIDNCDMLDSLIGCERVPKGAEDALRGELSDLGIDPSSVIFFDGEQEVGSLFPCLFPCG